LLAAAVQQTNKALVALVVIEHLLVHLAAVQAPKVH
jgi:hypothetical protein